MHPVTMQLGTKKGIIERKRRVEVTRSMGKYLWRANSCDGRTVDASSYNVVRNGEGNHRKEETYRSYESGGEIYIYSEQIPAKDAQLMHPVTMQ